VKQSSLLRPLGCSFLLDHLNTECHKGCCEYCGLKNPLGSGPGEPGPHEILTDLNGSSMPGDGKSDRHCLSPRFNSRSSKECYSSHIPTIVFNCLRMLAYECGPEGIRTLDHPVKSRMLFLGIVSSHYG
jgi:hypothetical protein